MHVYIYCILDTLKCYHLLLFADLSGDNFPGGVGGCQWKPGQDAPTGTVGLACVTIPRSYDGAQGVWHGREADMQTALLLFNEAVRSLLPAHRCVVGGAWVGWGHHRAVPKVRDCFLFSR